MVDFWDCAEVYCWGRRGGCLWPHRMCGAYALHGGCALLLSQSGGCEWPARETHRLPEMQRTVYGSLASLARFLWIKESSAPQLTKNNTESEGLHHNSIPCRMSQTKDVDEEEKTNYNQQRSNERKTTNIDTLLVFRRTSFIALSYFFSYGHVTCCFESFISFCQEITLYWNHIRRCDRGNSQASRQPQRDRKRTAASVTLFEMLLLE